VAAGGHAGGGLTLADTAEAAHRHGVRVGAHPSYMDRENFGRVSHFDLVDPRDLIAQIGGQILDVWNALVTEPAGTPLSHVKAHGALYNDAMVRRDVAHVLVHAHLLAAETMNLLVPLVGLPGSVLEDVCDQRDIPFLREGFADRAYTPQGTLVPRSQDGAVLHDADLIAERAVVMVTHGQVAAIDGSPVAVKIDTLCVHGDTPGAVTMARLIRERLIAAGVNVGAPS
jgi:5-oxoprolinase (ATP-hydrolysing) subunit A